MTFTLCACGGGEIVTRNFGDNDDDTTAETKNSVAGYYALCGIEESGEYLDKDDLIAYGLDQQSAVELRDDGTGIWYLEDDEFDITYNGSAFLYEEGEAVDYRFKDGQLVLYVGDEITFYFEKGTKPQGNGNNTVQDGAFPAVFVAQAKGDWHGWCKIEYGTGKFASAIDTEFEMISRLIFDKNGNCEHFFAIATEDKADNFTNITVSYDEDEEAMVLTGELFKTTISDNTLFPFGDDYLQFYLTLEEGDDYADICIALRRPGAEWDEYDDPCMPDAACDFYKDKDLIDIATLYGIDLDLIPDND